MTVLTFILAVLARFFDVAHQVATWTVTATVSQPVAAVLLVLAVLLLIAAIRTKVS